MYRDRGFQYIDEEQNIDIYDTTIPMFIDFTDSQLITDYFEYMKVKIALTEKFAKSLLAN